MPLIKTIKKNHSLKIAVWQIDEDPKEIFLKYPLSVENKIIYKSRSPKRQQEFLAVYCAFHALGGYPRIFYDSKGKPFSDKGPYISISHSCIRGAVALSEKAIGIDIEKEAAGKILYVSKKFLHPSEAEFIEKNRQTDYLHIIWGIKESLYKINGGSLLNISENYRVMPFSLEDNFIRCCIINGAESVDYQAYYTKINDFWLVYVTENE